MADKTRETSPAMRAHDVTKQFGDHVAVDALSFEVPWGAIYGILGPNGAGKSTTLRMINDILAPDAGRIELLGGLAPGREASERIGYLPEERGLYPKMRVLDTLQFFGELRGLSRREARRRGRVWLERLDIDDWHDNRVQDLSKGMQQKVQFITALLHEPELLILDEPWSGLDPINADVLRNIVLEQKAAGRTILFSTHLMEQAEKICEHVCIIARGQKVLDGALAQIKAHAMRERLVLVSFASDQAYQRASETVLADQSVVARIERRDHERDHGHDRTLQVELAGDVRAEDFLARLVSQQVGVSRFETVVPSLHQIFVDRVGADPAHDATRAAS